MEGDIAVGRMEAFSRGREGQVQPPPSKKKRKKSRDVNPLSFQS